MLLMPMDSKYCSLPLYLAAGRFHRRRNRRTTGTELFPATPEHRNPDRRRAKSPGRQFFPNFGLRFGRMGQLFPGWSRHSTGATIVLASRNPQHTIRAFSAAKHHRKPSQAKARNPLKIRWQRNQSKISHSDKGIFTKAKIGSCHIFRLICHIFRLIA
jgi:hypothetical protein